MTTQLQNAMLPIASFHIENGDLSHEKKLCLIPGHFNVIGVGQYDDSGTLKPCITYDDPTPIQKAGYACDYVADDMNAMTSRSGIIVTPNSERTRYRDFLSFIRLRQLRVSKIRLTNTGGAAGLSQFLKEMEVSASAVGSRAASDFINLAQYKNPANYDQNVIEIDLNRRQLLLDATTLAFITVAAGANFDIEFTLDNTPLA